MSAETPREVFEWLLKVYDHTCADLARHPLTADERAEWQARFDAASLASEAADNVERIVRGDRGFIGYGQPSLCTYGTSIEVYESSAASAPHVWLNLKQNRRTLTDDRPGEAAAHLDVEMAQELIARLQAWIDDISEHWS